MADGGFSASMVWAPVIKLAIIAIVVFLGRIVWRWFIFGSARKIERDMRNELYSHLQTLSASYFHKHKAGEIMAYISSDIEAVRTVSRRCMAAEPRVSTLMIRPMAAMGHIRLLRNMIKLPKSPMVMRPRMAI